MVSTCGLLSLASPRYIYMRPNPQPPSQVCRVWKLVYARSMLLPPQYVTRGTMKGSYQHDCAHCHVSPQQPQHHAGSGTKTSGIALLCDKPLETPSHANMGEGCTIYREISHLHQEPGLTCLIMCLVWLSAHRTKHHWKWQNIYNKISFPTIPFSYLILFLIYH